VAQAVKVGVVGCARILPAHLRGLRVLKEHGFDNVRITALCARKIEDAQMFRTRGEGPPPRPSVITYALHDPLNAPHMYVSDLHDDAAPDLYTDWREMLRTADLDAVLILATLSLHHEIAVECLRAGKHVFVEKPIAISVKAGQRMVNEARERGLQLGVAEVLRYFESVRILKWLLESGQIGDIQLWLSGGIGARDWSPDVIVAKTPWRHRKLEGGGGPALDGGVHLFDEIRYLCGEIDQITAMAPRFEPIRVTRDDAGRVVESMRSEVEDAYFAHLKFRSGACGSVSGGVAGHGEPTGLEGGTAIYGTTGCIKGSRVVRDGGESVDGAMLYASGVTPEQKERWFPRGITDGFALEWLDFLRSIETGNPMETDGEEGVRALACSFAVLESATLNEPVLVADVLSGRIDAYQRDINEHFGLV